MFSGVGKLNTKQILLHINPEVKLVEMYTFQFETEGGEEDQGVVGHGHFEPVNGPTPWVNAAVIVP